MAGIPLISDWIGGVDAWRRSMYQELEALPDTLRTFREGVANFQRVTKRLLDATEGMETFSELHGKSLADAVRELDEAGRALRGQLAHSPGAELVGSAFDEFSKALGSLADRNPFLRRSSGPS